MHISDSQLIEFIEDAGLVSRAGLEHAKTEAAKKKEPLGDFLVREGKITVDDLRRIEAYILGIPFVSLRGQQLDQATLALVPEPIARTHNIVAFRKSGETLEVAMLDVEDLGVIDFVKKKTGLKILPRLTDSVSIKDALKLYQRGLHEEFGELIKADTAALPAIKAAAEGIGEGGEPKSEADLKKLAEDLPVIRIVDTLLKHAVLQNASDIHIEPMENQVLVRYRIDGLLRDAMVLPRHAAESITARIKVLAQLKLDEKRLPQDGRFRVESESERVAIRVSILPTYFGEKTVMRLLRESVQGYTLEGLGFHGIALEQMHEALRKTTGMVLTTGPTGSGKTTTLYTMLDILNTPGVNISTIEDPIEYQMARVNQTQVRPEIGLTFASGLRTLVRQDPDIVMVGEIRDTETAGLAINAALTGHLVLSTLHTNSAAGAMPRLIDMKAEPFLLVSTLNVVIAQRLVRRIGKEREKYLLTKHDSASLEKHVNLARVLDRLKEENVVAKGETIEKIPFYRPKRPDAPEAYHGRAGIYEVLPVTSAIKELVMRGATSDEIAARARADGMLTMFEDGIFKAAQGITTVEEVLRVISE